MGIAYVVVAGICIVLGTAFAIAHLFRPRYGLWFFLCLFLLLLMFDLFPGNLAIIGICPGTRSTRAQQLLLDGIMDSGRVGIEILPV